MVAGVHRVGAVVPENEDSVVGDGDRTEVFTSALLRSVDWLSFGRVECVVIIDRCVVDHDCGVVGEAADGLSLGGDDSFDECVFFGKYDAEEGSDVL